MNPITIINRFAVKPGKMDEFIERQRSFGALLRQGPSGFIGGRMYRALDGNTAVLLSQFESAEAQEKLRGQEVFQQHVAGLQPLLESVSPNFYQEVYSTENFR